MIKLAIAGAIALVIFFLTRGSAQAATVIQKQQSTTPVGRRDTITNIRELPGIVDFAQRDNSYAVTASRAKGVM